MTEPVSVITPNGRPPPSGRRPSHRLMSITSGPMSEGMIASVRPEDGAPVVKKSNSTEHICMFSVCLMFIGIPIIVIGILCLSIIQPAGIILTMIGVLASVSGAVLVILTGIIALVKRLCRKPKEADEYIEERPQIIIDDTHYSEHFPNNLCEEPEASASELSDLPCMEQLDPVLWANYPEAQNPKSYLSSFGDLPKVMPSPDNRQFSIKTNRFSKKSKKSGKKIGRKISESLGMGSKHKTISRTSLTRDYNEEIHSDSSSSSLDSTSSVCSTKVEQNKNRKSANGFGVNVISQSIITIENVNHRSSDPTNSEEVLNNIDSKQSADQKKDKSVDKNCDNEQNKYVVNGILKDECTDSIELTEIGDRNHNQTERYIKDDEFDNYSDLWNSIRTVNKS